MRSTVSVGFRAWCVALVVACAPIARAAEQHPLLGATREQVVTRYGEPRSTLVRGDTVIFFYPRERITLRNGKVADVERLAEPTKAAPAPAPATTEPAATRPAPARPTAETTVTPALRPAPAATTPEPAAPAPAPVEPAPAAVTETPAAEPRVEIKRVLPKGAATTAPVASQTAPTAPATTKTKGTSPVAGSARTTTPAASSTPPPSVVPAGTSTSTPATATVKVTESATKAPNTPTAPTPASGAPGSASASTAEESPADAEKGEVTSKQKDAKKAVAVRAARRRLEQAAADAVDPTASAFTVRTYVFAAAIIAGGIAFLVWRNRQRQLALAATAVSRTPFSEPVAVTGGSVFTGELLAKLEWRRFEELVAQYYSKTGVVATRTKSGPDAAVHIKISWKGEPRPFALVQCIAHPSALIDAKPIQALQEVLMAEDIRRGYVVSSGKFNVPARDFAEEKHVTLMPGEIFLEKLNALPEAARVEIMQATLMGDYTTPSCPKCEAKMTRAPEDPTVYRCAAHPDQQIPASN